jgi:ABC-type lipoprotein export system ATPase subunit
MYKSYSSKYTGKQEVFKDFSIDFPSKGFVSILGKSGCGKTTLLNIIGGIDSIDKGYVSVFGYDISEYSNGNSLIDEYRKDIIGFVFQNYNLINNISVYRNLALPLEMQGYNNEEIELKIDEVLTKVEMIEYKNRMPYELSGGQQQRVAIARALIKKSKVVLADEPTGNLDSTTATEILKILKEISKDRLVIFITHDKEYADIYSDEVVHIKDGKIINDYELTNNVKVENFNKAKSKISIQSILKNSIENIRLNLVKNILIILLFSATIMIISSSIVLLTTTKNEILTEVIKSNNDELSTRIVSAQITETDSGDYALSYNVNGSNQYEIYDGFLDLQEKYGSENVILSSRVHLLDSFTSEGALFDNMMILVNLRMNLLDSDVDYDIPNLVGRMPESKDEVVISDLLSFLLFERDDALGEKLELNKLTNSDSIIDAKLTIVGIVSTDYLENGYIDKNIYNENFLYSGNASISTYRYSFLESNVYNQLYGFKEMFENLDNYYDYPGGEMINFQVMVDNSPQYFYGTILNKRYVDMSTLVGRLPENNSEISVSVEQLSRVFSDNTDDIDDLINGIISWDDFATIIDLSGVNVFSQNVQDNMHYEDIMSDSFTLVGAYELIDNSLPYTESVVLSDELIIQLNNAFPYDDVGISFVNNSQYLDVLLNETTSDSFNNLFFNYNLYYDREVVVNTEGAFNLYKALFNIEETILPMAKSILIGVTLFTFILMFLFSYLSIINSQKRIGIFRSLGYRRNDILKMFIFENGVILSISIVVGGLASIYTLIKLNQTIFSETVFKDLMLYNYDLVSLLLSILLALVLIISTSIFPLIKILVMTPINIINKNS